MYLYLKCICVFDSHRAGFVVMAIMGEHTVVFFVLYVR